MMQAEFLIVGGSSTMVEVITNSTHDQIDMTEITQDFNPKPFLRNGVTTMHMNLSNAMRNVDRIDISMLRIHTAPAV